MVSARAYGGVSLASALQPRRPDAARAAQEADRFACALREHAQPELTRVARSLTRVGGSSKGGAATLRLRSRGAPRPAPRDQCDAARRTADAPKTNICSLLGYGPSVEKLTFRFEDEDGAVILDGWAHRPSCRRLPAPLPARARSCLPEASS